MHHRHRAAHPDRRLPAQQHPYQVRDVDGSPITPEQGRAIVAERYPNPTRSPCRPPKISNTRSRHRSWDERIEQGVAKRSTMTPVPPASLTPWKTAFLAYFDTGRASNGGTEAINGLIELHRRIARGFTNRDNYRLRMLLIGGGLRHPHLK